MAGHVPSLEILSLSGTPIDDVAISYIGMMPSLKALDLSHTIIKGITYVTNLLILFEQGYKDREHAYR